MKKCKYAAFALALLLGELVSASVPQEQAALADLYQAIGASVVKIETDSGHGSGFVVDSRGWIVTNHHVIQSSRFLAVVFSDGLRVAASILAEDVRNDLAVLQVHPDHVSGKRNLEPSDEELRPGYRVVAFGSPLTLDAQVTRGIVSHVEQGTLTGDFLIEPGNSGGPVVLEHNGSVIGVSTFGVGGIAGAVRTEPVRNLLGRIGVPIPVDQTPLRQFSRRGGYPVETLMKRVGAISAGNADGKIAIADEHYHYQTGRFEVMIWDPVIFAFNSLKDELQQARNRKRRRGNRISKRLADPAYSDETIFYNWYDIARKNFAPLSHSVTIQVTPRIGETGGSLAKSLGMAALGVQRIRQNLKFKGEFYHLTVFRDGEELEPIYPGRFLLEEARNDSLAEMRDEAFSGMYQFDFKDFMHGETFVINVYDARKPDEVHDRHKLMAKSRIIQQIRADFRVLDR